MTVSLDPTVADEMRKRAQGVRDRQAAGTFTQQWSLTGKNAVVEPGRDVVGRLLPRWDYATSMVLDPATNTRGPNPAYKPGHAFVVAYEHWWDGEGGKTVREWCPRTLDPAASCAICAASVALSASGVKDDREYGKRVAAKEVFIFNAVVGDPRRLGQDGLVDIRILSVGGTAFQKIADIMTGGDKPQFARGDIMHPREGYDLAFKRPVGGGSERWDVVVAGVPTPLYGQAQAAAFKGWVTRLVDLPAMLARETKSPDAIYRAFYGRDPETGNPGASEPSSLPSQGGPGGAAESAELPDSPDDDFMPPPAGAVTTDAVKSAAVPVGGAAGRPPSRARR